MALDREPQVIGAAGTRAVDRIDEGLRNYMLQVYNYMGTGLVVSGLVAYFAHALGISYAIAQTPLAWLFILAPLAMVMVISFGIQRLSLPVAQLVFWGFAALMGVWLSIVLATFTGHSIARVFFITASIFGAMSLFGYTTKRDLSGWGSFLFMGLIGLIVAIIVNLFLQSAALHFAVSVIGVLVFTGLTAWETQRIKEMYVESDSADTAARKTIHGALGLYLSFINLFIMLMHLFGDQD